MITKVAIHSVPRSGSSWLGAIFDSHPEVVYKFQPLFSYVLKNALSTASSKDEISRFYEKLLNTQDEFIDQLEAKKMGIIPAFVKTQAQAVVYKEVRYHHILDNILRKAPDLKVIGLIRNPLAVIYSWWKAPKEFRGDKGWKLEDEWRFAPSKNMGKPEEFNGYEKWKEVAFTFQVLKEKYPRQFWLINYRDLLNDTENVVRNLFDFANLDFGEQTRIFLNQSKSKSVKNPYGVYRSKSDDLEWKDSLPDYIIDFVTDDLKNTELAHFLYK